MTNNTQDNDHIHPNDELDPQLHQLLDDLDNPLDEPKHDAATEQLLQRLDSFKPQSVTSGEVSDGVPDQVQESIRLDRRAQQRLDHQHDEIDFESSTPTTESPLLGDSRRDPSPLSLAESQERLPIPAQTDRPIGELADGVEDSMQESDEHTVTSVTIEYQLSVALPPIVQQTIQGALHYFKMGAHHGHFPLVASFQADSEEALIASLRKWVNQHLPIATGFDRVYSTVVGSNTYIAGWRLTNSQAIQRAQTALTLQLASLITPTPNPVTIYTTVLPLLPSIPAELFPRVVGFLQQHFHNISWNMESIVLQRRPLDTHDAWEVVQHIP